MNVNRTKLTLMITEKMFESRISAGAIDKIREWRKPHAKTVRGPTTWKDMPKSVLRDVANCENIFNRAVFESLKSLLG